MTPPREDTIGITSGVNAQGKAFVTLEWGVRKAQLTPNEARAHALAILECASAAESDAAFLQLLEQTGISGEVLGTMMREFRLCRYRQGQKDPTRVEGATGEVCSLCGQVIFPGVQTIEAEHGPAHERCVIGQRFREEQGNVKH